MKAKAPTRSELSRALYGNGQKRLNLESQIQAGVIQYLANVMGMRVFRRNVGGREWIDANGRLRVVRYGEAGMSDVWALGPSGLHIEVEIKAVGGVLSPQQREWLLTVMSTGAIAFVCSSTEECAQRLRVEFKLRGIPWLNSWNTS